MTSVLLAGGIMLALAIVFGVILVIFSQVFTVEKNAKIQEVENLLWFVILFKMMIVLLK